jgi:rhamnose utilization protein RhaD (predicted bifunctional aldolase and dehydrogenase)
MGQHGLINWADDDKVCYELTLDLIESGRIHRRTRQRRRHLRRRQMPITARGRARNLLIKLLPTLRGLVSQQARFIGTVHITDSVLEFVNSHDAARLAEIGTSCPDHFLRTKIKPLYVDWNPQSEDYTALLASWRRIGRLPRRLRRLLRSVQTSQLPCHARSRTRPSFSFPAWGSSPGAKTRAKAASRPNFTLWPLK